MTNQVRFSATATVDFYEREGFGGDKIPLQNGIRYGTKELFSGKEVLSVMIPPGHILNCYGNGVHLFQAVLSSTLLSEQWSRCDEYFAEFPGKYFRSKVCG